MCHVGSSEAVEETAAEGSGMLSAVERQNQIQHRANATVHVCWHRNTSVSARDMRIALQVYCLITNVSSGTVGMELVCTILPHLFDYC